MRLLGGLLLVIAAQEKGRPAKPEVVRVEVQVTALAGDSAYIDHGREAHLEPGDRARLFPLQGVALKGRVISVSRTSARVLLEQGLEGLDIGSQGEVWIPRRRLEGASGPEPVPPAPAPEAAAEPAPRKKVEPHPPWTSPPEEWKAEQPLLAPAHGLAPDERPRRFQGDVYSSFDWTRDSASGEDRDYFSGSLGFEGLVENPFGHGGELALDAEYFQRTSDLPGDNEHDSKLRLDRLSYAWGGVRGERDRGEVGRFLQHELPALGFLDGIEYVHRTARGNHLGLSAGFLPIPDDFFQTGDDLQAALFYRYVSGEEQRFTLGTGYQKTWHQGVADRDLVVAELELHPARSTSISSSAMIDFYTSGDDLKGAGPELTQLFVNATQRTQAGHGLGLFFSQFRWPELLREEFPDVTAAEIANAVNTRYGADGWLALGAHAQLHGRADSWSDQDDSGGGGRARLSLRDLLHRGDLYQLESYATSGKFTDTVGLRAATRQRLEHVALDLSWDSTLFDQKDVDEELLQHALRAQLEFSLGRSWNLALYAESRFGDEQDALALGFTLQRSFD